MNKKEFAEAIEALKAEYEGWDAPAKRFENGYKRTPYTIMVSVLLSFRTRDEITLEAGRRLFEVAHTPYEMVNMNTEEIAKLIYPVGFYRKKAQNILDLSSYLIERYDGKVPQSENELLQIKGIGPKAANIILESAFGEKRVAVDTHVHRIANRWGFLDTSTPQQSQTELNKRLTPDERAGLNRLLVSFGQVLCRPVKPLCNGCPVEKLCSKRL